MPDKTETPWSDWSDANSKAIEAAEGASAGAPLEQGAHEARCSVAAGSVLSPVVEYSLQGKSARGGDWRAIGLHQTEALAREHEAEYREWNKECPHDAGWADFRVVRLTLTAEVLPSPNMHISQSAPH